MKKVSRIAAGFMAAIVFMVGMAVPAQASGREIETGHTGLYVKEYFQVFYYSSRVCTDRVGCGYTTVNTNWNGGNWLVRNQRITIKMTGYNKAGRVVWTATDSRKPLRDYKNHWNKHVVAHSKGIVKVKFTADVSNDAAVAKSAVVNTSWATW